MRRWGCRRVGGCRQAGGRRRAGGRAPQMRRWLASPWPPRLFRWPEARGRTAGVGHATPAAHGGTSPCAVRLPLLRLPLLRLPLRAPPLVDAITSASGTRGGFSPPRPPWPRAPGGGKGGGGGGVGGLWGGGGGERGG